MRWILSLFAIAGLGLAIVLNSGMSGRSAARSVLRAVETKSRGDVLNADVEQPEPEVAGKPDVPPTERGDCTLELWLRDSRTGEPIEAEVRLYRIDIPADAIWSAGDQLHEQVTVPKSGRSIFCLPAGRYRVDCALQREAGIADAAFTVSGDRTRQVVFVETARTFEVWLTVTRPDGRKFSRGKLFCERHHRWNWNHPNWMRQRESANGYSAMFMGGGGVRSGRPGPTSQVGEGRYRVRRMSEPERRNQSYTNVAWWQPNAYTRVSIPRHFEEVCDQELHAIVIPLKKIYDAIRLPDGSRAIDHNADIDGCTIASPVTDANDRSAALREPIRVTARLRGYETLKFNVLPNESIFVRTMTPSK